MQPNSEPSQADIALVSAAIGGEPAPQPAPASVAAPEAQPAAPATPTDPFAAFTQPTEPVAPVAPTTPTQPTEPVTTPQQPITPVETPQPTPVVTPEAPKEEQYQSYEDYMNSVLANVPKAPDTPDPASVDPDDPAAIKNFFDDMVKTVKSQVKEETSRTQAIQASERALWEESFNEYGSLRTNKPLRDLVHNIRMGYFQRGVAITPLQAANELLKSMGNQYKQGVADNQVVTTIEQVQPNAGGTGAPVATTLDAANVLESLQTGGEDALAKFLDGEVKAGRL